MLGVLGVRSLRVVLAFLPRIHGLLLVHGHVVSDRAILLHDVELLGVVIPTDGVATSGNWVVLADQLQVLWVRRELLDADAPLRVILAGRSIRLEVEG